MHARVVVIALLSFSAVRVVHNAAKGLLSSKVQVTHADHIPGCSWKFATGCVLAEACKVPLANVSAAGAWGTAEALEASYVRRSNVRCDVSKLSGLCIVLLLQQAVK